MYLIYSALQPPGTAMADALTDEYKKQIRYQAYKAVCEKYQEEIDAIQKHFPNWKPQFDQ